MRLKLAGRAAPGIPPFISASPLTGLLEGASSLASHTAAATRTRALTFAQ